MALTPATRIEMLTEKKPRAGTWRRMVYDRLVLHKFWTVGEIALKCGAPSVPPAKYVPARTAQRSASR
jgi:hypothetical protein